MANNESSKTNLTTQSRYARTSGAAPTEFTKVSSEEEIDGLDFTGEAEAPFTSPRPDPATPLNSPKPARPEGGKLKKGKSSKDASDISDLDNDQPPVIAGLITQVDEDGNQVNVGPPTETSSLPENHSLCASIIRSLCCISYNEIYQNESIALLLEDQRAPMKGKKCLVLDLDETLVHSSFIAIPEADFKIEVSLDGKDFVIYVVKRPGVEEFLTELSKHYELVLFTASVEKYAQKVTQLIDPNTVIEAMLYREHCTFHGGNFVKDLNRLNRDLRHCIIVDNSPISYQFHPENAIGIGTFLTNKSDRELLYCKEFLMNIKDSEDVRVELKSYAKFLQNKFAEDYGKR